MRLFHGAIAQSGSAINSWGYEAPEIAHAKASKLAEVLGNATTNSNEIVEFLSSFSAQEVVEAAYSIYASQLCLEIQIQNPPYYELTSEQDVAVGDVVFLAEAPINIVREGKFNHVPFIQGTVANEGSLMFDRILWNSSRLEFYDSHPEMMVPKDLYPYLSSEEITALGQEIKRFYIGNEPISIEQLVTGVYLDDAKNIFKKARSKSQTLILGTDFIILYGLDRHVSLQAAVSTSPVYQYQLSFNGRYGMIKGIYGDSFPVVGHGDDGEYLFYSGGVEYDVNSPEYNTLRRVVKMWTNFAKTGMPERAMIMTGTTAVVLLLSVVNLCFAQLETVTVQIEQGELRGQVATTVNGLRYYSFLGIPYAKPPLGSLRFRSPQPPDPWDGVRDALREGSMCSQVIQNYEGDEDCLFINVATPVLPGNSSVELKPVMVHIHGGGFLVGTGDFSLYGPQFLLEEDVIVVRFLSTGDSIFPGNNGLKDQVMALRWVQQNIENFGGNPNSVTIFGVSAGGCSVSHLVLSPLTAGLFHRAIAQSGSALDSWGYEAPEIVHPKASRLCEVLGNATTNSNEIAEFLLSFSAQEIVEAAYNIWVNEETQIQNPPYYELTAELDVEAGEMVFLQEVPINIVREGKFNHVPFMQGSVTHEGKILWNSSRLDFYNNNLQMLVPKDLYPYLSSEEIIALGEKIKQFYIGDEPISFNNLVQFTNLGTDFIILYGLDRHVSLHAAVSTAPVYQYQLSFNGRYGMNKASLGDSFPAVGHGDDIDYIFYHDGIVYDVNSPEYTTLRRMVKLWTNFAKTGNPTPEADPLLQNVTWSPATALDNFYIDIGNDLVVQRNLHNERMSFWEDIYTSIVG
ncbi:hypothetical protein C0J52_16130 [Blattella germanica]|nr:hypothetical protein C0J52_16130 [Blattella germanica]